MPCLAYSPSPTITWQRPQMPRPPQTESTSTPSARAALSSGVPSGKRPRFPDGVKTTRASPWGREGSSLIESPPGTPFAVLLNGAAAAAFAATFPRTAGAFCRGAFGCRLAELPDPAAAVGVDAVHHVGRHDGVHLFVVQRVHDCRGHAGAGGHGQEGGVEAVAVRQAEGDVRGAAGRVDAELLAQPPDQREDLAARRSHCADRHDQRIDDHVLLGDAVVCRALDDLLRDLEAHVWVL